jgi:ribosomal protein S18 acetylase RimI-like enzyme
MQGGVLDDRPELLRTAVGEPVPWTNTMHAARLDPGRVDEEITSTMEFLDTNGVPGTWVVTPLSRPSGLGDALLRHGWTLDDPGFPWMSAPMDPVIKGLPDAPPGLVIEAVEDADAQARWLQAMTNGFGMGPPVQRAMTRLAEAVGYGPDAPWRRFVGTVDGRPVGSAGLMVGAGLAGIYNVSTPAEFRGRGIATALTGAALREGRDRGYRFAVLGASEMGYPVYVGMGFTEACRMQFYVWDREDESPGARR